MFRIAFVSFSIWYAVIYNVILHIVGIIVIIGLNIVGMIIMISVIMSVIIIINNIEVIIIWTLIIYVVNRLLYDRLIDVL